VVAASGGNHGAAVAFAARSVGVPAKIFVPEVSSPAKVARIRSYGADLVVGGASYHEARAASEDWAATSGALQVPAFDQEETILGAGSLGLELHEQRPASAAVLASVGGGGLLAGICAGYPGPAAIIGVEPAGAPTLTRALAAGRPVDAEVGSVAVDSLAPRQIGARNFPVLRDRVREVLLVSDAEIGRAQELLWDRLRLVGEPGGCTALAAVLSGRYTPGPADLVTVVLSGANTTAVDFSR
jgi:threonine dehydratase